MNTEQLKTDDAFEDKYIHPIVDSILLYHSRQPIKRLSDFAQQEIQRDRESRWISVKEKLPENKTWVMVWIPQRGMSFMAYRAGEMWESDLLGLNTVNTATHWQPLPEAPKL